MSFIHQFNRGVVAGGVSVDTSRSFTGDNENNLDVSIPNLSTDLPVNYSLDVSACKSFFMVSDKAMIVKTNSATEQDDTITLVANEPYQWNYQSYDVSLLTVDVVALFVTNASGAAAALKIRALVDPTP